MKQNGSEEKRKMMGKGLRRAGAFVLAVCLTAGIWGAAPAQAASKKASVYVMTKQQSESKATGDETPWTATYTYTYAKNGLLKECDASLSTYKYTYKKNRLSKVTETPNAGYESLDKSTSTYTYDKKGRRSKVVEVSTNSEKKKTTTTTIYHYDRDDRIETMEIKVKTPDGKSESNTYVLTYNRKNQVVRQSVQKDGKEIGYLKYAYDKNGLEKKIEMSYSFTNEEGVKETIVTTTTHKNTYKDGRLVKQVSKVKHSSSAYPGSSDTTTYTYKKIKVPAAYKALVEKQQADIMAQNILN